MLVYPGDDCVIEGLHHEAERVIRQALFRPVSAFYIDEPVPNSQLVNVSFTSRDPVLARNTANGIAEAYIDYNVESKFDAGQQARSWLEQQLELVKARLEASEEKLNRYCADNRLIYIEGKDRTRQSLADYSLGRMVDSLDDAIVDRIEKGAMYRVMEKAGETGPLAVNNQLVQKLRAQYSTLVSEYNKGLRTYRPTYPKMKRLKSEIDSIAASINREEGNVLAAVKAEYMAARNRESGLKGVFDTQEKDSIDFERKLVEYQILRREVDTNQDLYQSLLQRIKEIGVSATLTSTNIQVLDRAVLPKAPSSPNKPRNLVLALAIGLLGGLGAAFFVEYLDNTVTDAEEIERRMRLAPLGIIPFQKKTAHPRVLLESHSNERGPVAEAFRSLGTFILFSSAERPPKTILITSPSKSEGKTTVASNTAVTLTKYVGKVIIIDCDLRKSCLHRVFGMENGAGLSNYLSGNMEFGDKELIRKTHVENLDIILAGPVSPNPSELLSSARMEELLKTLSGMYSFVIIDSAPILGMADSVSLSSFVDGVIMVAMFGRTTRDALKGTKRIFDYINAKVLGVIVNGIKENDMHYGYYSYHYSSYYGSGNGDEG